MDALYLINDTVAITMILVMACSFALSAPSRPVGWLIGLITFSYIAYLITARQDYAYYIPQALQLDFGAFYPVLNIARNSLSASFLLLSHFLFRENERFPRILILLIVGQLILEEPVGWFVSGQWELANPALTFLVYEVIPACLQIVFLTVATYWVVNELRYDLVRTRRVARILMLSLMVGQGLVSLLVERVGFIGAFIPFELMYPVHHLLVAIQAMVGAVIVMSLMRRNVFDFLADRPVQATDVGGVSDENSQELGRIREALEVEQLYRQMGLTVADLAKHVGVPQYRLRELIHNQLGYRNFNAFLHHYRIQEVAQALQDPAKGQTPILTLALTAGYQSINPFNRAFKELKGMTPSEYRASIQLHNA